MKERISTGNAPKGPFYSQAVISGNLIFVAGQIHLTPEGKLVEGTTEKRFRQVIKNIEAILNEAGSNLSKVVKTTVYVTDINELPKLNEIYATYFPDIPPAREAVCVKALPLGASIEISVIAVK